MGIGLAAFGVYGVVAHAVAELTGYTLTKIQDCFADLKGSFLKLSGSKWAFAHPTISDALTEILRQKKAEEDKK